MRGTTAPGAGHRVSARLPPTSPVHAPVGQGLLWSRRLGAPPGGRRGTGPGWNVLWTRVQFRTRAAQDKGSCGQTPGQLAPVTPARSSKLGFEFSKQDLSRLLE